MWGRAGWGPQVGPELEQNRLPKYLPNCRERGPKLGPKRLAQSVVRRRP